MANICEKLIEEVSSGSAKLSPELQSHVLTCPDCRQYLDSLKELKAARKGFSAKEAAAVATIAAVIKKEAAASAAASAATGSSGSSAGFIAKLAVVFAALVIVFAFKPETNIPAGGDLINQVQPKALNEEAKTGNTLKISDESQKMASTTVAVTENAGNASSSQKTDWQNPAEQDRIDATNSTIVSPDQEDIKSR